MFLNKGLKTYLPLFLKRTYSTTKQRVKLGLLFKIGWVEAHKVFAEDRSFFDQDSPFLNLNQNETNLPVFYDKQNKIEQHYLPFHGIEVRGLITSYHGNYGIDHYYTEWVWTGKQLSPVTRCVTHWYSVCGTAPFVDYELGSKITQVFASFELPRSYVEDAMKDTVSRANNQNNPSNSLQELVPEDGKGSEIIYTPFEMKSNFALRKVTERLLDVELNRVSNFVRRSWNADYVDITINMNLDRATTFKMHSYYLPAYIHRRSSSTPQIDEKSEDKTLDKNHRYKILNAYTKDLSGPKIFSALKMGGLAGGIVGISMIGLLSPLGPAGLGLGMSMTQILGRGAIGFLATSSLTGIFTKATNSYKLWRDARQIEKDMQMNEKFESQKYDEDLFEAEPTKPKDEVNAGNNKTVKEEAKYLPSNVCHFLKLDHRKPITEKELKNAYHIQIRKWHPDIFSKKDNEKDIASLEMADLMTKEINNAYSILVKHFKK